MRFVCFNVGVVTLGGKMRGRVEERERKSLSVCECECESERAEERERGGE